MEELGLWLYAQQGIYVCAVCPDEVFSAYAVAHSLTNINNNDNIYNIIQTKPHVIIDGHKALYLGDITEDGQEFCLFDGYGSIKFYKPRFALEGNVIPYTYSNTTGEWLSKNKKSLAKVDRKNFNKIATLVGNKKKLLEVADNTIITGRSFGKKIGLQHSKGVGENGANIQIKSSISVNKRCDNFEIWSGAIPTYDVNKNQSVICCLSASDKHLIGRTQEFLSQYKSRLHQDGWKHAIKNNICCTTELKDILAKRPICISLAILKYEGDS